MKNKLSYFILPGIVLILFFAFIGCSNMIKSQIDEAANLEPLGRRERRRSLRKLAKVEKITYLGKSGSINMQDGAKPSLLYILIDAKKKNDKKAFNKIKNLFWKLDSLCDAIHDLEKCDDDYNKVQAESLEQTGFAFLERIIILRDKMLQIKELISAGHHSGWRLHDQAWRRGRHRNKRKSHYQRRLEKKVNYIIHKLNKIIKRFDRKINHPPTADDQEVTTSCNSSIIITLRATDPDCDPLTFHIVSGPDNGSLSPIIQAQALNTLGGRHHHKQKEPCETLVTLTYTPSQPNATADYFTFEAHDGRVSSDVATVSINIIPCPEILDFGDAPTDYELFFYPTLLADNGARHVITQNVFLGFTLPDIELDGQPTIPADGDDIDAQGDDEDGLISITPLLAGQGATVNISSGGSVPGVLNAWIDFNVDGDWDDPGEQIFTNISLIPAMNILPFSFPATANIGDTYARFRLTSAPGMGGGTPTGPALDGEVEDYLINLNEPPPPPPNLDFGDAPDPNYPTLLNEGARHVISPNVHLGELIDADGDGQPNATATGDDADGTDDEDGVTFGALLTGTAASVIVNASVDGWLNAWVDFNADGDWKDTGERIFTDLPISAGDNSLQFSVPVAVDQVAVPTGSTFARFRFTAGESPKNDLHEDGPWENGEVEDYLINIDEPPISAQKFDFGDAFDPTYPTLFASDGARHRIIPGIHLGATVDADLDGQPTTAFDGDDQDGNDDEDGFIHSPLFVGQPFTITINASSAGFFSIWLDSDNSGTWEHPGELFLLDVPINTTFSLSLGPQPIPTTTNIRIRYTSYNPSGTLRPTGNALDGEVEDYQLVFKKLDYGDAPDQPYPTLLASNGARHILTGAPILGTFIDSEPDGQPSPGAVSDDFTAVPDDEDGLVFVPSLIPGGTTIPPIFVFTSTGGILNAWIDFNNDGDWLDSGEQIAFDFGLLSGSNPLPPFVVPLSAVPGPTYARFRLTSAPGMGGSTPTGLASDGEVEDYLINIDEPQAPPI